MAKCGYVRANAKIIDTAQLLTDQTSVHIKMNLFKQMIFRSILIGLLCIGINSFAQTNRYFQNNECWSVYHQHGISSNSIYYICVDGDSIIGADTLVKFLFYGTHFYGPDPDYTIGSPSSLSFLAKENSQILTVYRIQADTICDTIVTDYSQMDSLTSISTSNYWASAITDTNSFNYYGNDRLIYLLNSAESFEGIFDRFGRPFIKDGMSYLICFSALDSLIYDYNSFNGNYEFIDPFISGDCVIHNVGIEDLNVNEQIIISPNPFTSQTAIHTNFELNDGILTIYNQFGQSVKTIDHLVGQTFNLSREDLRSGLYYVRLSQDKRVIATKKLFIID